MGRKRFFSICLAVFVLVTYLWPNGAFPGTAKERPAMAAGVGETEGDFYDGDEILRYHYWEHAGGLYTIRTDVLNVSWLLESGKLEELTEQYGSSLYVELMVKVKGQVIPKEFFNILSKAACSGYIFVKVGGETYDWGFGTEKDRRTGKDFSPYIVFSRPDRYQQAFAEDAAWLQLKTSYEPYSFGFRALISITSFKMDGDVYKSSDYFQNFFDRFAVEEVQWDEAAYGYREYGYDPSQIGFLDEIGYFYANEFDSAGNPSNTWKECIWDLYREPYSFATVEFHQLSQLEQDTFVVSDSPVIGKAAAVSGAAAGTEPPEITSSGQMNTEPPEITPGGQLNTEIPEITPGGQTNTEPPEITPGGQTNTEPPEITPGGQTNTEIPEITPGGQTNTEPPEITPGGQMNTEPPEITSSEQTNTEPPEITPSGQTNTEPPEITPDEQTDTEPPAQNSPKPTEKSFVLKGRLKGLKGNVTAQKGIKLRWVNHVTGAPEKLVLYRKISSSGSFRKIKKLSVFKRQYLDRNLKIGKKYTYKLVCQDQKGNSVQSTAAVSTAIFVPYLNEPDIRLKKVNKKDERYLQIKLKEYEGTNAQIYLSQDGTDFKRVDLHSTSIRDYSGAFLLRYQKSMGTVYCKVRTWKKIGGKKKYSPYSSVKKIKLN